VFNNAIQLAGVAAGPGAVYYDREAILQYVPTPDREGSGRRGRAW